MTLPRQLGVLVVLALFVTACNSGVGTRDASPTPVATHTTVPTVAPTATPSVEEEVSQAYLHYWEVYAEAVFNLDESRLSEVMTDPDLERAREEVETLRQGGRAAKIVVEHNFVILQLDPVAGTATIRDEYTNNSYEVDANTKEMIGEAPQGNVLTDTYFLVREGGTWRVRDGIRENR
jgi:hypothetical protein